MKKEEKSMETLFSMLGEHVITPGNACVQKIEEFIVNNKEDIRPRVNFAYEKNLKTILQCICSMEFDRVHLVKVMFREFYDDLDVNFGICESPLSLAASHSNFNCAFEIAKHLKCRLNLTYFIDFLNLDIDILNMILMNLNPDSNIDIETPISFNVYYRFKSDNKYTRLAEYVSDPETTSHKLKLKYAPDELSSRVFGLSLLLSSEILGMRE